MKSYLSFNYPTDDQLEKINSSSYTQYKNDEVYVSRIKILDNNIDTDNEKVTTEALKELGECFIGKSLQVEGNLINSKYPSEYQMRIINYDIYQVVKEFTIDNEPLTELYIYAYTPIKNISNEMYKQIEEKAESSVTCAFAYSKYEKVDCGEVHIGIINGVRDAYEIRCKLN